MFEARETRFSDLLRRSLDCALEFATLGEYRLRTRRRALDSDLAAPRRSAATGRSAAVRARVVMPATAAGRMRNELLLEAAVADRGCEGRGRRDAPGASRQRSRKRDGAAAPAPQPCLWAEA
jgi:hypothetical protein